MRRGRIITGTITIAAAGLIAVSSAFAASPSEIAKDLADGQLNGTYSQQELENFLKNATVQGYPPPPGAPVVTPPGGGQNPVGPGPGGSDSPTTGVAGVQTPPTGSGGSGSPDMGSADTGVAGAQSPLGETAQVGALPFTGLDLALLVIGGVLLLALGLGARRAGRRA